MNKMYKKYHFHDLIIIETLLLLFLNSFISIFLKYNLKRLKFKLLVIFNYMYLKYLIWLAHVFQGWYEFGHQRELFITKLFL